LGQLSNTVLIASGVDTNVVSPLDADGVLAAQHAVWESVNPLTPTVLADGSRLSAPGTINYSSDSLLAVVTAYLAPLTTAQYLAVNPLAGKMGLFTPDNKRDQRFLYVTSTPEPASSLLLGGALLGFGLLRLRRVTQEADPEPEPEPATV